MNCRLYIMSYYNASHTLDEQFIDERISEAPALSKGHAAPYDIFWTKSNEFIS